METRRTVLRHVTGALALGMGGLNLATVQAQAQTPKRGGTLTFAISAETPARPMMLYESYWTWPVKLFDGFGCQVSLRFNRGLTSCR